MEEFLKNIPEWNDDQTMRSLFSSFAQNRHVNPESFDHKIQFWKNLLFKATSMGLLGSSVFTIVKDVDPIKFQRNGLCPPSLDTVIKVLEERGDLAKIDCRRFSFFETIMRRFSWLSLSTPVKEVSVPLVAIELVENCTSTIKSVFGKKTIRVFLKSKFIGLVNEACSPLAPITDDEDIEILLCHLERAKLIVRGRLSSGETIIKYLKSDHEAKITNDEIAVVHLASVQDRLHDQIVLLTTKLQTVKSAVLEALARQDRSLAKTQLSRSHMIEKVRNQRLDTSHTLETILLRLDSAQTDAQVVKALDLAHSSLSSLIGQSANIEEIMDNLSDLLADQSQIEEAISGSVKFEEADLEEELQTLISSEKIETKMEKEVELDDLHLQHMMACLDSIKIKDSIEIKDSIKIENVKEPKESVKSENLIDSVM